MNGFVGTNEICWAFVEKLNVPGTAVPPCVTVRPVGCVSGLIGALKPTTIVVLVGTPVAPLGGFVPITDGPVVTVE